MPRGWIYTNVFAPLVLTALFMTVSEARAHEWYPWDCCSGYDCAPVMRSEPLPGGALRVTTQQGSVTIPAGFTRRPSEDDREHVCMRPDGHGGMRPLCYFVPAGS
jgi:hypothetical protein